MRLSRQSNGLLHSGTKTMAYGVSRGLELEELVK